MDSRSIFTKCRVGENLPQNCDDVLCPKIEHHPKLDKFKLQRYLMKYRNIRLSRG